MQASLETELAALLVDLLATQDELSEILTKKRQLLAASDVAGMAGMAPQEQQLLAALQDCLQRRESLLARASREGFAAASIQAVAKQLPPSQGGIREKVNLARRRGQLLQQQNLVNWVIAQRTLLHLSRLLEIIATGGRLQPTYGERAHPRPAAPWSIRQARKNGAAGPPANASDRSVGSDPLPLVADFVKELAIL